MAAGDHEQTFGGGAAGRRSSEALESIPADLRVVLLPDEYTVFDLTTGDLDSAMGGEVWGVGRYNERRRDVYRQFFHGDRDIHVGVDLFGPAGTEVRAFADGEVFLVGDNDQPGDYGPTIVCRHYLPDGHEIYALYGHLSRESLGEREPAQSFKAGEVIARLGEREENGGWAPHVHFQLAWEAPAVPDMPGVVTDEQQAEALGLYPDPRLVLGPVF